MLISIKHLGLKRWFYNEDSSGLTPHLVPIIDDILARLNVAEDVTAMNLPRWNLHPKRGVKRVLECESYWKLDNYFSL